MEFSIFETSPVITLTLNEKQLHSPTYCKLKGRERGRERREEKQGMCFLYL